MRIVTFEGTSLVSKTIGWFTRSGGISHCGVLDDRTNVYYDAKEGVGVRRIEGRIPGFKGQKVTIFKFITPIDEWSYKAGILFLEDQVGKPYDYRSVFKFLTRRDGTDIDKWFCSEYVARWAEIVKRRLQNKEFWKVSPYDVYSSPIIYPFEEKIL